MIRLNVFIEVGSTNRGSLLEIAKELVAASLKDDGCIAYDIYESSTRKDVLMICETWRDEKALEAHSKTPHFIALVPKIEKLGAMKMERFIF